jgi:hypothetical protein
VAFHPGPELHSKVPRFSDGHRLRRERLGPINTLAAAHLAPDWTVGSIPRSPFLGDLAEPAELRSCWRRRPRAFRRHAKPATPPDGLRGSSFCRRAVTWRRRTILHHGHADPEKDRLALSVADRHADFRAALPRIGARTPSPSSACFAEAVRNYVEKTRMRRFVIAGAIHPAELNQYLPQRCDDERRLKKQRIYRCASVCIRGSYLLFRNLRARRRKAGRSFSEKGTIRPKVRPHFPQRRILGAWQPLQRDSDNTSKWVPSRLPAIRSGLAQALRTIRNGGARRQCRGKR